MSCKALKLFNVGTKRFQQLTTANMFENLQKSQIIYIGERHHNSDVLQVTIQTQKKKKILAHTHKQENKNKNAN